MGLRKHHYEQKASGGDGIPAELFQILKDDALKVLYSICQQIWKTQQCPQTGKGQFLFQPQIRTKPKNVQTTTQLCSFHMLARVYSKSFKLQFSVCEMRTSRCTNWVLKRQRNQRSNCQHYSIMKKTKQFQENYAKIFNCVDHNKL